MRLPIVILLPFLLIFTVGRILRIALFGWAPAAIRAVYTLSQYDTDRKIAALRSGD